jgi:hypothetical protein
MPLTTAAAAATILNNALGLLKSAREQAKGSNDIDLKETISSLFDVVLDLKQAMILVIEENDKLRAEREQKPTRKQVGEAIYYFVGDDGPFCQPCYDDKTKLVALTAPESLSGGGVRRQCLVCQHYFYEKRQANNLVVASGRGGSGTSWMGN